MPKISGTHVGLAFDMHGCPNRCRHCYLGPGDNRTLTEEDVRWGVSRFRQFLAGKSTPVREMSVATWFREPDFSNDYRKLYELERELGDGDPKRFELLSVWRLAHDDSYAQWAKSVGPDTCQISFFGTGKTTDWFCRRKGAFDDAITASERLLNVGMKPRWQVFLTTKLLPELNALLDLVDQLHLRERVRDLDGDFQIFLHSPGPDYEARKIEEFRPTSGQVAGLPDAILMPTRRHFKTDVLWHTEEVLYSQILDTDGPGNTWDGMPEDLWFFVCNNWDVFSNVGTLEPWYCLGNLKQEPVESIVKRFEEDDVLGLQVQFRDPSIALARRYGNPKGQRIYRGCEDLLSLYRGIHCQAEWNSEQRT